MLCAVIKGPSYADAHDQILQAKKHAQLVELRLDYFTSIDNERLAHLRAAHNIPMIFTLRGHLDEGLYTGSEEERYKTIQDLAALQPEYLDLEYHTPSDFLKTISQQYPGIQIILSYHNFKETPEDLDALYKDISRLPAAFYKIALHSKSCLDTMRFILWKKKKSAKNIIAISMGNHGQISRILSPLIKNLFTYAAIDDSQTTAAGQLSAQTLSERYHSLNLTPETAVYGLIGDPVDLSISDETHNHFFFHQGLNAVYVKIVVKNEELQDFLNSAKEFPIRGLSVTMPLKECVMAYLDAVDPGTKKIGAVNTLLSKNNQWFGFNTDGMGALNALESHGPVKGKRVLILGAGGAAKAIACEAIQRGCLVTIINRDEQKARQLAQKLNCASQPQIQESEKYDILINCTSAAMPIDATYIQPHSLVMDIKTKPYLTDFLQAAIDKGCPVCYGYQMFIEQAIGQFQLWFTQTDHSKSHSIISKQAIKVLKIQVAAKVWAVN